MWEIEACTTEMVKGRSIARAGHVGGTRVRCLAVNTYGLRSIPEGKAGSCPKECEEVWCS